MKHHNKELELLHIFWELSEFLDKVKKLAFFEMENEAQTELSGWNTREKPRNACHEGMNTKWSPRKKPRTLKCKISYRQLHVASPIYNGVQAQKNPCSPLMQLRLGNLMKISWNRIDVNLSTLPAHWDGIGSQEKRRVVWCARMSLQRQTLGSRAIARSWLSCRKTGILTIIKLSRKVGSSTLWIIEGKIEGDRCITNLKSSQTPPKI